MQIIEFKFQNKFKKKYASIRENQLLSTYKNGGNDPIVIRYCVFA